MEKLKEALITFADSNPSIFRHDGFNSHPSLIEQRFSQFFFDFQTPNHPPYAAMIHKALRELNEKRGSSEESISKYIKQEFVDLPWAHSTFLKHHLEKLCDCKEISITRKKRYLLAGVDSDPISNPKSEKQLKRKQDSETGKKNSGHNKKLKKSKKKETKKQITEVFQDQENVTRNELLESECLEIKYHQTNEEGNSLIDVCVQENGVCANDKEQKEIQSKKKRKSKKRGKNGKKNENTQLQDSSEANLKQNNEEIDCELHEKNPQIQGKQVWTKSRIKKMSNMPKGVEYLSEEKQQTKETSSSAVSKLMNGQRSKLRSFKKKKGVSIDKDQKKQKTRGRHDKMPRRSIRKRKAPSRLD
ncbi:unnamed protein product [Lactuca saligna]|uniref:H15 domain-containing protein n=1 Tax=Lactuca saligna TaxID=75948 RepID=A0AA36DY57_LACSI|nr:unnamed protein product [Lactuca saligna]